MSKIVPLYILIITAVIAYLSYNVWISKFSDVIKNEPTVRAQEGPSIFEEKLKPLPTRPVRLFMDNVLIDLALVVVGVTGDGALETPADWKVGGWYKKSTLTGEFGNMVINAHYDDNLGRPAGFWELKNVKVGDKVYVEDDLGRLFTYEVSEIAYVAINDPDRLKVLHNDKTNRFITLITCGGVWLPGNKTYNQRLVVKGVLVAQ